MGSRNLRRRNLLTAAALLLIMLTFVPYVGERRIEWFMWRDMPLLALGMLAGAAVLFILWQRTPKE